MDWRVKKNLHWRGKLCDIFRGSLNTSFLPREWNLKCSKKKREEEVDNRATE